jgi:hypothetical protein
MLLILAGLAVLLTIAVVKKVTANEPITILKTRVVPLLHLPDNDRNRPFGPADVHLIGDAAYLIILISQPNGALKTIEYPSMAECYKAMSTIVRPALMISRMRSPTRQ